jgi:hypothetical protein
MATPSLFLVVGRWKKMVILSGGDFPWLDKYEGNTWIIGASSKEVASGSLALLERSIDSKCLISLASANDNWLWGSSSPSNALSIAHPN